MISRYRGEHLQYNLLGYMACTIKIYAIWVKYSYDNNLDAYRNILILYNYLRISFNKLSFCHYLFILYSLLCLTSILRMKCILIIYNLFTTTYTQYTIISYSRMIKHIHVDLRKNNNWISNCYILFPLNFNLGQIIVYYSI